MYAGPGTLDAASGLINICLNKEIYRPVHFFVMYGLLSSDLNQ